MTPVVEVMICVRDFSLSRFSSPTRREVQSDVHDARRSSGRSPIANWSSKSPVTKVRAFDFEFVEERYQSFSEVR